MLCPTCVCSGLGHALVPALSVASRHRTGPTSNPKHTPATAHFTSAMSSHRREARGQTRVKEGGHSPWQQGTGGEGWSPNSDSELPAALSTPCLLALPIFLEKPPPPAQPLVPHRPASAWGGPTRGAVPVKPSPLPWAPGGTRDRMCLSSSAWRRKLRKSATAGGQTPSNAASFMWALLKQFLFLKKKKV